jgi:hypothetical protein
MSPSAADLALARDLLTKRSKGQRVCVPVFGTGLNIQAATVAGYAHRDDWSELLAKIGRHVLKDARALDDLPRTHLALWESLLCLWARQTSTYPFQAENVLQQLICRELRAQEEECRSFGLYRNVIDAGFSDIISLNFDRRIALSSKTNTFVTGPNPCPLGSHGESLFRHSVVQRDEAARTRIWYPHGDVKKAATLKFGVRKYGFHIGVLREYMGGYDGAWRYRASSLKHMPTAGTKGRLLRRTPNWVSLFLERPLVFVGCGLSPQEWALWWLLRRRSELGAPPAICLTIGQAAAPPHLRDIPELRAIAFDTPAELWRAFLSWVTPGARVRSHA